MFSERRLWDASSSYRSSNLRSVVYLSPSFVVAMERNPLFSIWLAIQAPHAPSRCRESYPDSLKRANDSHPEHHTLFSHFAALLD